MRWPQPGDDVVWVQITAVTHPNHPYVDVVAKSAGRPVEVSDYRTARVGILTPVLEVDDRQEGVTIEPFGIRRQVPLSELYVPGRAHKDPAIHVFPDGPGSPYQSVRNVREELQAKLCRSPDEKG